MLLLSFQPDESAVLDFSLMTDAEFKQLKSNGCRVTCVGISKRVDSEGHAKLGFEFPRSVRIVRSTLLAKESK